MLRRPLSLTEAPADHCKIAHTDCDVKHVQPGEPKESPSEQRDARIPGISPRSRFLTDQRNPLCGVDYDERDTAKYGCNKEPNGFLHVPATGRRDSQHHCPTAGK